MLSEVEHLQAGRELDRRASQPTKRNDLDKPPAQNLFEALGPLPQPRPLPSCQISLKRHTNVLAQRQRRLPPHDLRLAQPLRPRSELPRKPSLQPLQIHPDLPSNVAP